MAGLAAYELTRAIAEVDELLAEKGCKLGEHEAQKAQLQSELQELASAQVNKSSCWLGPASCVPEPTARGAGEGRSTRG